MVDGDTIINPIQKDPLVIGYRDWRMVIRMAVFMVKQNQTG